MGAAAAAAAASGAMKLSSPAAKAVVTACVSAALGTVALRGFHRRSVASGRSADLPDVGTSLVYRSSDRTLGRGRRALREPQLTAPLFQRGEAGHVGGEEGTGARFPALEGSTVMFLHIFKCAGSTLRWDAAGLLCILSVESNKM